MRRIAVVAVLAVALAFSGMAFAFDNEPEGFRDLKWGDPPTETMEYFDDVDEFMKVYSDPDASNKLGDVYFYRMFFAYYVDVDESLKFAGVTLFYQSKKHFETLQTLCKSRFGPATDEDYQEMLWEGIVTSIHLKHDSIEEEGFLSIDSTRLWNKYLERKEQKQVEDAEGDW